MQIVDGGDESEIEFSLPSVREYERTIGHDELSTHDEMNPRNTTSSWRETSNKPPENGCEQGCNAHA